MQRHWRTVTRTRAYVRAVRRGRCLLWLLLTSAVLIAATPSSAFADTATSSNWSGYAAHKRGVKFNQVSATWTQPAPVCTNGEPTYSSFWVGLGGYSASSNAVEQVGTELDCTAAGRPSSYAWYELVPAPTRAVRMTVRSGDHMKANVTVVGKKVTLRLSDTTRHESFVKKVTASSVDVTSADWVAEAPSECTNAGFCQTLPLTNFRSTHFASSSAETASGRRASISGGAWNATKIILEGDPGYGGFSRSTPSALRSRGKAFDVRYSQTAGSGPNPFAVLSAGGALQPGGRLR
jgi:hypothetical protein